MKTGSKKAKPTPTPRSSGARPVPARQSARPRPGRRAATSKRDRLDAMLQRPEGVTIGQITKRFGIQPHSARALISVARKRLGKEIAKGEDGRYRVGAARPHSHVSAPQLRAVAPAGLIGLAGAALCGPP